MASALLVFNQYYWDLLKKVKDLAKDLRHQTNNHSAKTALRSIKRFYLSFDKQSDEHVEWYKSHVQEILDAMIDSGVELEEWVPGPHLAEAALYKGITLGNVTDMFRNKRVALYYLTLLSVFALPSVSDDPKQLAAVLEVLKKKQPWTEDDFSAHDFPDNIRTRLKLLESILAVPDAPPSKDQKFLQELESTSLGRLATEIMKEVDVEELSNTIGEDGDILKALGNPDGGMAKLLGSVSQKMISKLASGELKQETLMKDAMTLASKLPSMAGGTDPGLGDMASLMENVGKMANMFGGGDGASSSDMDFGSMMSQFSNMMGGAGGNNKSRRSGRATVNQSAVNRITRSAQLRRKLEARRKKGGADNDQQNAEKNVE